MPAWIKSNLGGLLRFSGRSARGEFWPYAGVLFVVTVGLIMAVMQGVMSDFMAKAHRIAAEHPEMVQESIGPGSYSMQVQGSHPEFAETFARAAIGMGACGLFFILFIAAAVARRLHDRGKRGWWGALPIPFLAFGLIDIALMVGNMEDPKHPDLTMFFVIIVNNVIYLASLLFVALLLAGPGTPGPNRYGDPPA